ncbi:hypothetical protein JB92DRAFT_2702652 [Gautieria morchelliformis]|nr:hypothetical protein JB92DRAFT_2702652 [Gautieria morchelliformis]
MPAQLNLRTVYDLPITAPRAGDTFTAGGTTSVAWHTAVLPASGSPSHNGTLVLGFVQSADFSEYLDTEHPLASGFSLQAGAQSVTFPEDLPSRDDYIIVLFGDSGNISPRFIIQAQPTLSHIRVT